MAECLTSNKLISESQLTRQSGLICRFEGQMSRDSGSNPDVCQLCLWVGPTLNIFCLAQISLTVCSTRKSSISCPRLSIDKHYMKLLL